MSSTFKKQHQSKPSFGQQKRASKRSTAQKLKEDSEFFEQNTDIMSNHNLNGGDSTPGLQEHSIANSDVLTQDSILKHQAECKIDNKLRLKEVKNLEELIQFRIKTVSDKLIDEGTLVNEESQKRGLHALRKVVDPLLTSQAFPATVTKKNRTSVHLKDALNDPEDSLLQLSVMSGNLDGEQSDENLSTTQIHKMVDGVTKKDEKNLMTETGTILVERKTVKDQIDEILKLDDQDPIRKLQLYFKNGHYGHEVNEDGQRMSKQYKPPKHKNYIMQRFMDQRKREMVKDNKKLGGTFKQRSLSHQDPSQLGNYQSSHHLKRLQEQLYWQQMNGGQGGFTGLLSTQFAEHPNNQYHNEQQNMDLNTNFGSNGNHSIQSEQQQLSGAMSQNLQLAARYSGQAALPSNYRIQERGGVGQSAEGGSRGRFTSSQLPINSTFGKAQMLASRMNREAYKSKGKKNKNLMEKSFLGQLKGLQDVIKESMLDNTEAGAINSDADIENSQSVKVLSTLASKKSLSGSQALLPELNKLQTPQQFRRGSTIRDMTMLDKIKTSNDETNLIDKYIPNFGAAKDVQEEQTLIDEASETNEKDDSIQESSISLINGEKAKESGKNYQYKKRITRRESIQQALLEGVDSDDEILDDLVKRVEEIHQLEKAGNANENNQDLKVKEAEKMRELLQLHSKDLDNLSSLTSQQRQLLLQSMSVGDQRISVLSRFANIERKDYVTYNMEQMRIYTLLNGQNDSQKRMQVTQQRRKDFEVKRESTYMSNKISATRQYNHSAETLMTRQGAKMRGKQPFSNKRFVEDLSKQSVDFKYNNIAERLPKIKYKSLKNQEPLQPIAFGSEMIQQDSSSQKRVRKLDLSGFTVPSKESAFDERSDQTINMQISGKRVSQRKHSQGKLSNQLYISSNTNQIEQQVYHRRIPTTNNSSSVFEMEKSSMRISKEQEARNTQFSSALKSTMREAETQVDHQVFQNKTTASPDVVNGDLEGIGGNDLEKELTSQQINGTQVSKQEFEIDLKGAGLEGSQDRIRRKKKSSINHSNVSDDQTSEQRISNVKVGGKSLEKDQSSQVFQNNGNVTQLEETNFHRTRIDLKKQSQQQSIQQSEDFYNYEVSPKALALNEENRDIFTQPILADDILEDEVQKIVIYDEHHLTDTMVKSEREMQTSSMPFSRPDSTNQDQDYNMETVDQKDSIMSNDANGQETITMGQNPSDGVTTKMITSQQQEPVNSHDVFESEQFTVIKTEKEKLNSSTETMKIDPISLLPKDFARQNQSGQDQIRLNKLTDYSIAPGEETISKFVKEVEVPQGIEIRHVSGSPENLAELFLQTVPLTESNNSDSYSYQGVQENKNQNQSILPERQRNKNSSGMQTSNSLVQLQQDQQQKDRSNGYESAIEQIDPQSFAFLRDVHESMQKQLQQQRQGKNRWHAKRFKKFPRFSIYLQRDKTNTYLERNYISLNNKMLEFLAEKEPEEEEVYSIREVDRDSMESSERAKITSQIDHVTIDNLNELSKAQVDVENLFVKHGTSTAKDDNSVQEPEPPATQENLLISQKSEEQSLAMHTPNAIHTAHQTYQTDRSKSQSHQNQNPFNSDITLTTKVKFMKEKKERKVAEPQTIVPQYRDGPMTSIVDPFDRVLLLKNIDNAILTSFRTLTKQNNVISHTLKVIHNKFTPQKLSRHVKNQYKKAQNTLYPVSEVESVGDLDLVSDQEDVVEQVIQNQEDLIKQDPLDYVEANNNSAKDDLTDEERNQETLISSVEMSPSATKLRSINVDGQNDQVKMTHSFHITNNVKKPVNKRNTQKFKEKTVKTEQISQISARNDINRSSQQVRMPEHTKMMIQTGERLSTPATLIYENEYKGKAMAMRSCDSKFKKLQEQIQTNAVQNLKLAGQEATFNDAQRDSGNFAELNFETSHLEVNSADVNNNADLNGRRTAGDLNVPQSRVAKESDLIEHAGVTPMSKGNMLKQICKPGNVITSNVKRNSIIGTTESPDVQKGSEEQATKLHLNNSSSALKIADSSIHDVHPPSVYHVNQNTKIDSQRSSTNVPKAAGFRPSRPNEKRHNQLAGAQPVKIQMASVDEYLGEHQSKEQPLHPSFKTSKIILRLKNSKANSRTTSMQDQGVDVKSRKSRQSSNSPLRDVFAKDGNTQVALATGTSFNTGTFYDSSRMRFMHGSSEQRDQSQTNFSITGNNKNTTQLAILEEEKGGISRREEDIVKSKPDEFQLQLNSIINQVKDIHGKKKTSLPNRGNMKPSRSKKPFQQENNINNDTIPLQNSSSKEIKREDSVDTMPYHSFIGGSIATDKDSKADSFVKVNLTAIQQIKDIKVLKDNFDGRQTSINNTQQPTNRVQEDQRRVETAHSALLEMDMPLDHHIKPNKIEGTHSQAKLDHIGTPNAKLSGPLSGLDHMLVQASPSIQSVMDSSVRMSNKLPNSKYKQKLTYGSNKSSAGHTATFDDSGIPSEYVETINQKTRIVTSNFQFQEETTAVPAAQESQRQSAYIKQGQHAYVKVPQPQMIPPNHQAASIQDAASYHPQHDNVLLLQKQPLKITKQSSDVQLSDNLQSLNQSSQQPEQINKNLESNNDIAQRIVKPQPVQKMRQMIDSLCMKEKSFVYSNPNAREDCIGTQNSIFDLQASHLVNRPGMLTKQEKNVKRQQAAEGQEAEFTGASFLAGQKAPMTTYVKKPADIRRGREFYTRS